MIDPFRLDAEGKSLSVENTFAHDLKDLQACLNELPALGQQLVTRLRRIDDDYKIEKLFVKIKFSDFSATTIERSASALSTDNVKELCTEAYSRKYMPVRLLNVGVSFVDLRENEMFRQLNLFD